MALAARYRHVLVDEFQDTDPLQIEILWRLCGDAPAGGNADPMARPLRPGALFLVGDPKQAIYRFRGADVNAYVAARETIGPAGLRERSINRTKADYDVIDLTAAPADYLPRTLPGEFGRNDHCSQPLPLRLRSRRIRLSASDR